MTKKTKTTVPGSKAKKTAPLKALSNAEATAEAVKVATLNRISDPKAFVLAGLNDVEKGEITANIGCQTAAAGIMSLIDGEGWTTTIDGQQRTITASTLRTHRRNKAKDLDDDAGDSAYDALREYLIGKDPSKKDASTGQRNYDADAEGKWAKRSRALRKAYALACKLLDDGYTVANYTGNGFRVMKSSIAPSLLVNKRAHIATPLDGSPEDAIILNPAKVTTFVVKVDGAVKASRNVPHGVEAYMASGEEAGSSRATGKTIAKSCKWLTRHVDPLSDYDADTMNAINAAYAKLSAVINETAKRAEKRAAETIAKAAKAA